MSVDLPVLLFCRPFGASCWAMLAIQCLIAALFSGLSLKTLDCCNQRYVDRWLLLSIAEIDIDLELS